MMTQTFMQPDAIIQYPEMAPPHEYAQQMDPRRAQSCIASDLLALFDNNNIKNKK